MRNERGEDVMVMTSSYLVEREGRRGRLLSPTSGPVQRPGEGGDELLRARRDGAPGARLLVGPVGQRVEEE